MVLLNLVVFVCGGADWLALCIKYRQCNIMYYQIAINILKKLIDPCAYIKSLGKVNSRVQLLYSRMI